MLVGEDSFAAFIDMTHDDDDDDEVGPARDPGARLKLWGPGLQGCKLIHEARGETV